MVFQIVKYCLCLQTVCGMSRRQSIFFSFGLYLNWFIYSTITQKYRAKMFEQMKNIRKYDFPLDRYDNDPFLKNPLLKYRQNRIKAKRLKRNDKQQTKFVSEKNVHCNV